jgi:hypothetical protein
MPFSKAEILISFPNRIRWMKIHTAENLFPDLEIVVFVDFRNYGWELVVEGQACSRVQFLVFVEEKTSWTDLDEFNELKENRSRIGFDARM